MQVDRKPRRILIVDDEQGARKLVSLILSDTYPTETAENVDAAIKAIDREPPAMVVTDIKMPGRDGLELLSHMSKNYPKTPVILMTGHGDKEMAIRAIKEGAFDLLEKPFGEQELKMAVRRASDYSDLAQLNQRMFEQLGERNRSLEEKQTQMALSDTHLSGASRLTTIGSATTYVALEVTTPLNVIQGLSEMLLIMADDHPIRKDLLVRTSKDIHHLTSKVLSQVRGLSTLSRDASQDPFALASVDEIVRDVEDFFKNRFDQMGVQFEFSTKRAPFQVECRSAQLFQVVCSLVHRALESFDSTFGKRILVSADVAGEEMVLRVQDSGKKFGHNEKSLFSADATPTLEADVKGHLEFVTCRNMVDSHHGRIFLTDDPETTFEVHLPLRQEIKGAA